MAGAPLLSVIIPAYNRGYLLRHAVGSVLASTLADLEVIVVGDHCTDDTEAVAASIHDTRLRFVNLAERCGEQSGPNNHGLGLARGRLIAFLNQDDLYFPDHLQTAAAHLERSGADLVWTPTLIAEPLSDEALRHRRWRLVVGSTPPGGTYDPLTFCVASSWVFTRRFVDLAGPWRMGSALYVSPSQDWLYQAWRAGARLLFHPHPSVLVVYSGARTGSYAARTSPEHEVYARDLASPGFREELLEAAAMRLADEAGRRGDPRLSRRALRACAAPLRALCSRVGLHPSSAHFALRLHRRGDVIRRHRRTVDA